MNVFGERLSKNVYCYPYLNYYCILLSLRRLAFHLHSSVNVQKQYPTTTRHMWTDNTIYKLIIFLSIVIP